VPCLVLGFFSRYSHLYVLVLNGGEVRLQEKGGREPRLKITAGWGEGGWKRGGGLG
jgi:hypothetical protein